MSDSMAQGGINANLDFKNGPQSLPTGGPENVYPFGIGGMDTTNPDGNDMSADDERPSPPNPDAQIGTPADWQGTAPVKYPFPKDSSHTGLKESDAAIIGG